MKKEKKISYAGYLDTELFKRVKQDAIFEERPIVYIINRILKEYCREKYGVEDDSKYLLLEEEEEDDGELPPATDEAFLRKYAGETDES